MFFQIRGQSGIPIGNSSDILMLFYADDAVLFGDSYTDIRAKLKCLETYCKENHLSVNTAKTKIIRCAKSHRKKPRCLTFNDVRLEYVSSYNYLGTVFSNSGVFLKASKNALAKARTAISAVMGTCTRAKIVNWEARIKLLDAVIMGTLLYAASVWGLRYSVSLETCHLSFFKSLLGLPRGTPNFAVRLEVGVVHIKFKLLKLALNWLYKLKAMPSTRYPFCCFIKLVQQNSSNNVRYNWISQLCHIFDCIDFSELLQTQDLSLFRNKKKQILNFYANYLKEKDIECVNKSNFSLIYSALFFEEQRPQFYFLLNLPFKFVKFLAQLRLSSKFIMKITIDHIKYVIKPSELCPICNKQQQEDLYHILSSCPMYTSFRNHYLQFMLIDAGSMYFDYPITFRNSGASEIKNLFSFFTEVLKLRAFLLNK